MGIIRSSVGRLTAVIVMFITIGLFRQEIL